MSVMALAAAIALGQTSVRVENFSSSISSSVASSIENKTASSSSTNNSQTPLAGSTYQADESFPRKAEQIYGYILDEDYPMESRRLEEAGVSIVRFVIGEGGNVVNCGISESSGFERLDGQSCALILTRFRFKPARDADGIVTSEVRTQRIRWQLPHTSLSRTEGTGNNILIPRIENARTVIEFDVGKDGQISNCQTAGKLPLGFSGSLCTANARFEPFVDERGNSISKHVKFELSVSVSTLPGKPPTSSAPK